MGQARITEIEPATLAEIDRIYDAFELVIVPQSQPQRRLHLPTSDDDPMCTAHPLGNGVGRVAPLASYPRDADGQPWMPICRYCLDIWRERGGDSDD